jgi:hypothetical protein
LLVAIDTIFILSGSNILMFQLGMYSSSPEEFVINKSA